MKFVWDIEGNDWADFAEEAKSGDLSCLGECIGSCRVGDLCFDIRPWGDEVINLGFELFCGGVDTGYGYSAEEAMKEGNYNDKYEVPEELLYPYDEVGYGEFPDEIWTVDLEQFKAIAEGYFRKFISETNETYGLADLAAKANEPLHIW